MSAFIVGSASKPDYSHQCTMAVEEPKIAPISTTEIEADSRGESINDDYDKEHQKLPRQGESTFNSTEDPRFYRPIDTYEGLHRWDPHFEWTEEEERKIVWKVRYQFRR
jgi:hypothetical protein